MKTMWPSIIALALFLVFLVLVVALFLKNIIVVIINAAIIYFISLKILADIKKRDMLKDYLIGLAGGIVVLFFIKNLVPLWWPTQIIIYSLVIVKTGKYFLEKKKKL